MSDWSGNYVVQVPYTENYYRELSPDYLRFICKLSGYETGINENFNWCELGYGQGITGLILSAVNPSARFYGTDFNPDHHVRLLRRNGLAALKNTRWDGVSFEQYLNENVPAFDFIVLHGVYSWVDRERRQQILRFIDKKAAPGCLVYVSYNAMPGWASLLPLARLLGERARATMDESAVFQQVVQGIAEARELQLLGSRYFQNNPVATQRLGLLDRENRNYLAHEYLNRNSTPLYHSEVREDMGSIRCEFVSSVDLADAFDTLCVSGKALDHLREMTEGLKKETHRDYILDTSFRRDLYVRGRQRLTNTQRLEAVKDVKVVLCTPSNLIKTTLEVPVGRIQLDNAIVGSISSALTNGGKSLGELSRLPECRHLDFWALVKIIAVLVRAGFLAPIVGECRDVFGPAQRLNKLFAQEALSGGVVNVWASPIARSAIGVSRVQQMFAQGCADGLSEPGELAKFVWRVLRGEGRSLEVNGAPLATEEANLLELEKKAREFLTDGLPFLNWHSAFPT